MSRARRPIALAVVAALTLTACSAAYGDEPSASATAPTLSGELVVFAAASLQGTFTRIGDLLMAENPDLTVTFNFGSSGTLATQIVEGAPADVFASANTTTLADAAGAVEESRLFAHNSLVIVVPAGNTAGITGIADFADADLKLAACDPSAPCGSAAEKVFAAARVTAALDTFGQDAKATLSLAVSGEVDAALVYRTDAIAAGDAVETISFRQAASVVNDYPIATVKRAPNPRAAVAFVDLVLSPVGQAVLADAGFGAG